MLCSLKKVKESLGRSFSVMIFLTRLITSMRELLVCYDWFTMKNMKSLLS